MTSITSTSYPVYNFNATPAIKTNNSFNSTTQPFQCLTHFGPYKLTFQIIIIVIGAMILVTGVLGNLMVVRTVYQNRHGSMSSLTYTLIASLSIYDIFVVTLTLPFTIAEDLLCYFPFGRVLCHLFKPLPAFFATGSVFTMTAIGIDRYRAVACSLEYRGNQKRKALMLVGIFILGFICSLTSFILTRYDDETSPEQPICYMNFITLTGSEIYVPSTFVFLFILPLMITITIYLRVIAYLRWLGESKNNLLKKNRVFYNAAARSSIKMMLVITMLFVACWLPLYCCFFIIAFRVLPFATTPHFYVMYAICHLLSYINAVANPIIYAGFNKKFRSAFKSTGYAGEAQTRYTVN